MKYLDLSALNTQQLKQYRTAIQEAFPAIVLNSPITKKYWQRLEEYYPFAQIFMIDKDENIIGFMNAIPLFWDQSLSELPNEGWDWQLQKGINDYENQIEPNTLGGLQIIVTKEHQGKGFSRLLLARAKQVVKELGYQHFIIPIRPTFKHQFPAMKMTDYINKKEGEKIYDPWIRTHLKSQAKIIKVCENSMNVKGDIPFWESLLNRKITSSGEYMVEGALNLVKIDVEKNHGEYREENIWVSYT